MNELLMLNGPNLGRLGKRKPEIYGTTTLDMVAQDVQAAIAGKCWRLVPVQSNSEADLIDTLEAHRHVVGAVINPGALMMNGWSFRDALEDFGKPWIEIHLSNVWAREPFRHESILSPLASGVIAGVGAFGYTLAAQAVMKIVEGTENGNE